MKKKILNSPLISLTLLLGISGIGFAEDIVFTAPNQTINFEPYRGTNHCLDVQYYGDTLALFYPKRDLGQGFKNFKFYSISSAENYIHFTFVFYANPNTPQVINDKTFYSDYFVSRQAGLEGFVHSIFVFGLGTSVEQIRNISFFSTGSNINIGFSPEGIGFLDFTLTALSIEYTAIREDGTIEYRISKATETAIIPSDEATATLVPLLTQSLYLSTFDTFSQRMRQLHDTPQIQGAWANITNGGQKSKLGIKSNYTSFQAGYDYDLGNEEFSNFIGGGIAYTFALPTFSTNHISIQDQDRKFSNLFSHSIAFAFYNSYLQGGGDGITTQSLASNTSKASLISQILTETKRLATS